MTGITTKTTINTTITLTDISEASYKRILAFIGGIIEKEGGKKPEKKAENNPKPEKEAPAVPVKEAAPDKPEIANVSKWDKMPNYQGKAEIIAIFERAEANPEGYSFEWITARDWMKLYPEFNEMPVASVGHFFGDAAKRGYIGRKSNNKNPTLRKGSIIWYSLPVPVGKTGEGKSEQVTIDGETDETPRIDPVAVKEGHALRDARNAKGYSLKNLAELMGYDAQIVMKWECGAMRMSSEAKSIAKMVLCDNVFTGGAK